jgi:hypothetical protein
VFAQHLDHPPVGGELGAVLVFGEVFGDPEFFAAWYTACSLFDVFSSGPNTRKFVMFSFMTSRRKFPNGGTFSA